MYIYIYGNVTDIYKKMFMTFAQENLQLINGDL